MSSCSYSFQGLARVWVPRDEEENRAIFSAMRQETGIKMPDEFKPIYLENEEYEVEKWSTKQLIRLIRLYGSHRCLWDPKDQFNKNRKMRKAALVDITAAMGDDMTMEQVVQKINVVRSTYRYEKRRIKQRIRKGVGAKTKLKWFALADSFLRKIPRLEKFRKSEPSPDSDSDLEDTIVFSIDPGILIPLDEEGEGNQNHISIADDRLDTKVSTDVIEIEEKMEEIHQILERNLDRQENKPKKRVVRSSDMEIMELLKLYRKHRCLYDWNISSYKSGNSRKIALRAIAKKLGEKMTTKQVIRKIRSIWAIYKLERLKESSRLNWFPLADSFLRPFVKSSIENDNILTSEKPYIFRKENGVNIKKEEISDDTGHCSNAGDYSIYCDYSSNVILKKEIQSDNEKQILGQLEPPKVRIKPMKRPWSKNESLQFVDLYKNHPCLWNNTFREKDPEYANAINSISKEMDISVERIKKRIEIFKPAYDSEKLKTIQSPEYKSNLAWFQLADNFFSSIDCAVSLNPTNFVDANALPPPTPQQMVHRSTIKEEAPDSPRSNDFASSEIENEVNPIPSIDIESRLILDSCPSHSVDKEMTKIKDQSNSEKTCLYQTSNNKVEAKEKMDFHVKIEDTITNDTVSNIKSNDIEGSSHSVNGQSMKLIWNGLEDDLLEGKWSLKHSVKFLRLYGAHRCLWDLNDPDYRCRDSRNAAIDDIAAAMGYGLDYEYVAKKIKIFRITYMQHRKRMLEAIKAGQEPEIQLKWFPLADSFLRPHIGLRSIKSNEKEMPQFDFQYVYANLNLIDPSLLNDLVGKGTQNSIEIGPHAAIDAIEKPLNDATNNEHSSNISDIESEDTVGLEN